MRDPARVYSPEPLGGDLEPHVGIAVFIVQLANLLPYLVSQVRVSTETTAEKRRLLREKRVSQILPSSGLSVSLMPVRTFGSSLQSCQTPPACSRTIPAILFTVGSKISLKSSLLAS
jgi:hypothetical protein